MSKVNDVRVNLNWRIIRKEVEEIADEQLKEVAEEIVKEAKKIAPVDTGAYRDNIHVEKNDEGHWAAVADVKANNQSNSYAGMVEFAHNYHTMYTAAETVKAKYR